MGKKESWGSFYRRSLSIRGNNTTNYVEVVFRVLKDCILDRVMAFNLTQLVDFIITRYELYMKQRLTDFSNGRYSNSMLKKMLPYECDLTEFDIHLDRDHIYKVKTKNCEECYFVDIIRGICSCNSGQSGKLCRHSSAVVLQVENDINTSFNLYLPPLGWFTPLHKNVRSDSILSTETNSYKVNEEVSLEVVINGTENNNVTAKQSAISEEKQQQLQDIFRRINTGLQSTPDIFVPAVREMLKKRTTICKNGIGLHICFAYIWILQWA